MKILVSGATGFVGSTITRHLLDAGHEVRAMSRSNAPAITKLASDEGGRQALREGRLTFVEADVTKPATLPPAVQGVEAVVQAAQFTGAPVENPARGRTYDAVDRQGTVNLLEAVKASGAAAGTGGAPRLLYMSGISVSANPATPWDRAKWLAEEAIRGTGLGWTIVRGCWAYGPDDAALNRIIHYSDYLPFVPIFGDGEEPVTPLFVEDIGRFYALVIAQPEKSTGTTFGLGGPDLVTLAQFLRLALDAMGRLRPIFRIPKAIGKVQGALMQHLPGRPLSPDAVDFVSQAGALSGAERLLLAKRFPDFRPTPVRDGLNSYLRSS